ncbi:hypothetical protein BXY82_0074 [Gelidibacter sediminis]|uniref:Uncharacterized protein n=1 Tax=Gelidibacter sediminis TaxID=1608710 RepID=A0A4R7Q7I1_9FLAO|nr:hypothetical protein [Gelidibacter sediminis]TDU42681.1 hypothetical protein BXY82_0074 [Gelidibacter sediminis]
MSQRIKITIVFLILLLISTNLSAQTSDLLRIEYLHLPNNSTQNSVNRFRGLFQLPLKLKNNGYLVVGGDYRYIALKFDDVPFNTTDLNSIQTIEGSIGYLHKMKDNDWYYGFKVGMRLASNFNSKLVSDDYLYLVSTYAIRDRTKEGTADKPNRLVLGLDYSTTPGRNYPLPILNYYREFHPNWTYTLGVPKTNVRYKFDDSNHVQAFVTLDNFFANLQEAKLLNGKRAENISQTIILGGLGYEHYFTEHLLYYGYAAYSISNDYRLRNNKRDDIYTIDDKNTLYFRTGLKIKY